MISANVSFTGLTSDLKRTILSDSEIKKSMRKHKKSRGYVGSLPREMIVNIPKEERAGRIKDIYSAFSKAVKKMSNRFFGGSEKASEILKESLVKNKVIEKDTVVRFSNLGAGDYADVYKLDIGDKSYAVKHFTKKGVPDGEMMGNRFEQNRALYMNAKEGSNWAKFYFGNLKKGYMVSKYIPKNGPKPNYKIDLNKKGVTYLDEKADNIVNDVYVDYGSIVPLKNIPIKNKVAVKTYGEIVSLPEEKRDEKALEILNNRIISNYDDRKLGVDYYESLKNKKEGDLDKQSVLGILVSFLDKL